MKKAVMIGAGNIGRGFLGQIFHDSGYEVVFVDVDTEIIGKINSEGSYKLTLTDGVSSETRIISNVNAINSSEKALLAEQLAQCDIAATSVGMKALSFVAEDLAAGIKERNRKRIILSGEIPSPLNKPSGCSFHTRCPQCQERCKTEVPTLKKNHIYGKDHYVACHIINESNIKE